MNIEVSTPMLKLIDDLYRTGLYGASHEEVARRLIEERIKQLLSEAGRHGLML